MSSGTIPPSAGFPPPSRSRPVVPAPPVGARVGALAAAGGNGGAPRTGVVARAPAVAPDPSRALPTRVAVATVSDVPIARADVPSIANRARVVRIARFRIARAIIERFVAAFGRIAARRVARASPRGRGSTRAIARASIRASRWRARVRATRAANRVVRMARSLGTQRGRTRFHT